MNSQEIRNNDKKPVKNDDQRMIIIKNLQKLYKPTEKNLIKMNNIKIEFKMYEGRKEYIKEEIEKKGMPIEAITWIKLDKIEKMLMDKINHGYRTETEEFYIKLEDLVDKVKTLFAYGNKDFLEMTDETEESIEEIDKKQSEEI